VQTIEDRVNIAIGKRTPDEVMSPLCEFDLQHALNAYNAFNERSNPSWNACHGGAPLSVIRTISDGQVPLVSIQSKWIGYPYTNVAKAGKRIVKKGTTISINGYPRTVQEEIYMNGPVVLGVNAATFLNLVDNGVTALENPSSTRRNHAVAVIGWTRLNEKEMWIARNSWGVSRAPLHAPANMNCVSTNAGNKCEVLTLAWEGLVNNKGHVLIPFQTLSLSANPSPWYAAVLDDLDSTHGANLTRATTQAEGKGSR
jgi:hypothetical protein